MKRPEQRGRTCPYHGAMIYVTRCGRAGIVVAMIGVLGWLGGCSDAPTSAPPPPPPPPPPTIAIVSDTAPAAGFASGPVEASVQQASAADEVVYVSLTPGTVPAGATATIRRVGGAASLVTTLSDGGFDPVPVEAQTNESIEVVVRDAGGTTVADLRLVVAVRRPPVVVRTNPPHKKNDVPLNAAIIVVFSEPVDGSTLTIPAYVRDASGNVLLSPTVEWASSDSSVAVVRPGLAWWQTSGREAWLTLRAGGVATITATSEGLSYTVVVRSRPVPSEPAGSLGVTTTTTGTDFDPNGYSLTVAGVSYQRLWGVPVNGSVTLPGVPVGEHSVTLNELAPNCAVIGANPQTVTITAGTTSQVAFAVTCGSGAPSLRVTISTTGGDLDTTGYRVNVLGFGFQDGAPVNGPVAFYFIPPGAYQVELQDIAANCVVSGANRQTVTVTGGATAELAFAVTCSSAANGSIRITTVTTGEDVDPNGYYAAWGASGGSWLQANGSVTVPAVPAGVEGVGLSDVASNCAIVGGEWKTVTVTAGATNDVTFAVTCAGDLPSLDR